MIPARNLLRGWQKVGVVVVVTAVVANCSCREAARARACLKYTTRTHTCAEIDAQIFILQRVFAGKLDYFPSNINLQLQRSLALFCGNSVGSPRRETAVAPAGNV